MNQALSLALVGVLLSSSACAHKSMRGSVAMKISDQEAHVCMGDGEVEKGDKVTFFMNECKRHGSREVGTDLCKKVVMGTGEIVQPLNQHYSVVRSNSGVRLEEGMIVEKGVPAMAE